MVIAIIVNGQLYKTQDLGSVAGYNLAQITDEISRDYEAGLLGDLAPSPQYSLSIQVISR